MSWTKRKSVRNSSCKNFKTDSNNLLHVPVTLPHDRLARSWSSVCKNTPKQKGSVFQKKMPTFAKIAPPSSVSLSISTRRRSKRPAAGSLRVPDRPSAAQLSGAPGGSRICSHQRQQFCRCGLTRNRRREAAAPARQAPADLFVMLARRPHVSKSAMCGAHRRWDLAVTADYPRRSCLDRIAEARLHGGDGP